MRKGIREMTDQELTAAREAGEITASACVVEQERRAAEANPPPIVEGWTKDRVLTRPGTALEELLYYKRRVQELLETTNRYLERARAAEAFIAAKSEGAVAHIHTHGLKLLAAGLRAEVFPTKVTHEYMRPLFLTAAPAADRPQPAPRPDDEKQKLQKALRSIEQLALGPDKGSSAWQANAAHEIARDALKGLTPEISPRDAFAAWLKEGPALAKAAGVNIEVILRAPPATKAISSTTRYRHKKRGTEYMLLGFGKMQAETWYDARNLAVREVEMREVAIYRSFDDGSYWVRPREDFEDGRFELVSAITTKGCE